MSWQGFSDTPFILLSSYPCVLCGVGRMEDARRQNLSRKLVHDDLHSIWIGLLVGLLDGEVVALQCVASVINWSTAAGDDGAALIHRKASGGIGLRDTVDGVGAIKRSHIRFHPTNHPRKLVMLQTVAIGTDGVRISRVRDDSNVVVVRRVDVAGGFDDGMEGGAAGVEVGEAAWIGVADGLDGRQAGRRRSLARALGI